MSALKLKAVEIFTIIGPNGAGKSTLFKLITSFTRPTSGRVISRAKIIPAYQHTWSLARGVVRTFQETTIFKEMTVVENVIVAHHLRSRASSLGFFVNSPLARRDEQDFRESANSIIEILGSGTRSQ